MRQADSIQGLVQEGCLPEGAARQRALQSVLTLDRAHPFYFDHQLDHIPGIMLVAELLKAVRAAERQASFGEPIAHPGHGAPGARESTLISISFPRFCELDPETELHVYPAQAKGQWDFTATQAGHSVCAGYMNFLDCNLFTAGKEVPAYPPASTELMPGYLVHRYRGENILIGKACQEDEGPLRTAVLSPGTADHLFMRLGGDMRLPEELIEAGRQVAAMLWSHAFGWPPDARLILDSISAELPTSIHRSVPLELRWWPESIKGNKALIPLEVVSASDTSKLLGVITFNARAVTETVWRRVRAARIHA